VRPKCRKGICNDATSSKTTFRTHLPSPAERLSNPSAFLSRTDLRELGLERRAVDAVFRACDVVVLPGYRRPLISVCDYLELIARSTYDGRTSVR
jgi:hypothetical protein